MGNDVRFEDFDPDSKIDMPDKELKGYIRKCFVAHKVSAGKLAAVMKKSVSELLTDPNLKYQVEQSIAKAEYYKETLIGDAKKFQVSKTQVYGHMDGDIAGLHSFVTFDATGRSSGASIETHIGVRKHEYNMILSELNTKIGKEWRLKNEKSASEGGGTSYGSGLVTTGKDPGQKLMGAIPTGTTKLAMPKPEAAELDLDHIVYYMMGNTPPNKDPTIKRMADAAETVLTLQLDDLNNNGGDLGEVIPYRKNYFPMQFNHGKVMNITAVDGRTSREIFVEDIKNALDLARVGEDMAGRANDRQALHNLASEAAGSPEDVVGLFGRWGDDQIMAEISATFDSMESSGASRKDPDQIAVTMEERIYSPKRNREKIWYWKNAEAFLEIHKKYGNGAVYDSLLTHVDVQAAQIATQEKLGSNPEKALTLLTDHVRTKFIQDMKEQSLKKNPDYGPISAMQNSLTWRRVTRRDMITAIKKGGGSLKNRMDKMDTELGRIASELERMNPTFDGHQHRAFAEINASARNFITGIAIPVTFTDVMIIDPINSIWTAAVNSADPWRGAFQAAKNWIGSSKSVVARTFPKVTPGGMTREALYQDFLGRQFIETTHHRANIIRQTSRMMEAHGWGGSQWSQQFVNTSLRIAGIPKGSNMQLETFQLQLQGEITMMTDAFTWEGLKEKSPVLYERLYSYGMRDKYWKKLQEARRNDYSDNPGFNATYIDFASMNKGDALVARRIVNGWWQTETEKIGLSMGGPRGHVATVGGGKSGEGEYEIRANAFLLRKYPWEYISNRIDRAVGAEAKRGTGRIGLTVTATLGLIVLTGINMGVKEQLKGRAWPDMTNKKFLAELFLNSTQIFRMMGLDFDNKTFTQHLRGAGGPMVSEGINAWNLLFAGNNSGILNSTIMPWANEDYEPMGENARYNIAGYIGRHAPIPIMNQWFGTKLLLDRAVTKNAQEWLAPDKFYDVMSRRDDYRMEQSEPGFFGSVGGLQNEEWWPSDQWHF